MKKILVIHTKYRNLGGEDIAVDNEIEKLKKHFEIKLVYFSNQKINFLKDMYSFITNKNKSSQKILTDAIRDFKPDLAYVHNTWYKGSLGIFDILKKEGIKTILKLHNFRYSCTQSFLSGKHLNGNSICSACGYTANSRYSFNKYFKESYLKSLLVFNYGRSYLKILKDENLKIFVLTNHHKHFLLRSKIRNSNIEVVPNYLDVSIDKSLDSGKKFIVYAGRISKEKGVEELINSFVNCKFQDIDLKIIGAGPDLDNLKGKYKIENIQFLGEKKNHEVLSIISESIAVVSATKLFEGQPTLLCEASFIGIPSIFPLTGGITEFFPHDYKLAFKQFDYNDLKKKLCMVQNVEVLRSIGEDNKNYILDYLDESKMLSFFTKEIERNEK